MADLKRLELRHLRLIKALAELGTQSEAAQTLHLSQSALSHQLKAVESALNETLFHRHGKRLVLTLAGHRVLNKANQILETLNNLDEELEQLKNGERSEIRIATECYTTFHFLPRVIPTFKKRYPNVAIQLRPEIRNDLTELLNTGELDIAIRMAPQNEKFENHKLFTDEVMAVMAPDHPLAKHCTISAKQLKEHELLLYQSGRTRFLNALFAQHEIPSLHVIDMPLTEALLEWCAAGLGVCIMARWSAKRWIDSGEVVVRPIDKPWVKRTWCAVMLKQTQPEYIKHFLEVLKASPPHL